MRKPSLLICGLAGAAVLAAAACSEPPSEQDVWRGGWDGNSGNYNGNLGSFGTLSGLRGIPDWAPSPTGPGTVNNATIYGLQYASAPPATPCARATPGIVDVRFLSSTRTGATAIGPDVEVERTGGASARLALGETIVFAGHVFDGYLDSIDVMFEVQRVDTLVYRNATWYAWPVFALRLCENSHAGDLDAPAWKHMGFVSWAPFARLPELDGETFEYHPDLVQAVTTIPRAEYRNNPNVPAVVAAQTGALLFKFAFFSGSPVALRGEPALDLQSSFGRVIPNAEFIFRGGMALGDMSWVTLTAAEDPAGHRFPSFFTRDGTEVALFSVARGDDAAAGAIHLPASWGGAVVSALELTDDEKTPAAAASLDNVQASVTGTLATGERVAASPTHEGSGRSTYRAGLYLNSPNNRKYWYFAQLRSSVSATHVGGIVGRVASQGLLESEMVPSLGPIEYLVAAESPLPDGTPPFEQPTNVDPPPPGAPVIPPMQVDGGVDAAMADAMTDAGGDAAMADAGVDAPMADAGADAAIADAPIADAGFDAPILDAPMTDAGFDAPIVDAPMIDAGFDAPLPPVDAPTDAGFDAPLPPIDAPTDAGLDAMIDAPDAMDAMDAADAMACFVGCDDAGPG